VAIVQQQDPEFLWCWRLMYVR